MKTVTVVKSAKRKLNFLISKSKYMLWILKNRLNETVLLKHSKRIETVLHMLKLMGKKILTILC